jgi:hypothetical protein
MDIKELDATALNFGGHLASSKWTLCIGAGASRGILPTWLELSRRLVNYTFSTSYSEDDFGRLVSDSGWGLDSWIQACANHYRVIGKSNAEFFDLIERQLYADLRDRSRVAKLEEVLITVLDRPRSASIKDVERVCDFLEREYARCSLVGLVRFLLRAVEQGKSPEAIISFNADTLLHTLIELYERREHHRRREFRLPIKHAFKTVLRPLDSAKTLIAIYHCHGAIKPKPLSATSRSPRDSRDRAIFLESEYIRVATEASSWAETLFMFHAQTSKIVFVGLSMSDPNMRRWMALSNQSALQDLKAMTNRTEMTPRHIWLTTDPSDPALKRLRNESLIHLGIRPGWLRDWSQIEHALCNLLSV